MKIDFLGIQVDSLTMSETIELINNSIRQNRHINHVVINAGKVVAMQTNKQLFESVVSCDIINADGQSIVWAARFLGKCLPERVAGVDLMQHLVLLASQQGYKCFFLGAREEIVKKVADIYIEKYGSSILAGYRNGYFTHEEEPRIAKQIADSGAQLLFVAITSPRKENFMYKHRKILSNINFTMGVGGTFDIIAGYTKRAPVWMQKIGIEWFYRFIQEPRRMWYRYLIGNTKFVWTVLKEKGKATMQKRQTHFTNNMDIVAINKNNHLNNVTKSDDKVHYNRTTYTRNNVDKLTIQTDSNRSGLLRERHKNSEDCLFVS